MDSLITAAALALTRGDPLGALNRVALRDDAPALALRGIAMAQLGDLARARTLLRRAARAFSPRQALARARCVVAEIEIALVSRDLGWPARRLDAARATLEAQGDHTNAAYARHLEIRRLLLTGHLDAAEQALDQLDTTTFAPAFKAACELIAAGIAMRRIRARTAQAALARAEQAARQARIPPLMAEVEQAFRMLNTPAARLIRHDSERPLLLGDVESLLASGTLVIDACRYVIQADHQIITLAKRPVLFTLARVLGEAWPNAAPRDKLIACAFHQKHADETHRARLRVEIGRLRQAMQGLAGITATTEGFRLELSPTGNLAVLARPVEEKHGVILAFLADGEAWSSSSLALVLGTSQRTVQRALDSLAETGKVQAFGHGRARRWMASPVPGFTTALLLPGPLPGD